MTPAAVYAGNLPSAIAISPDDSSVYVANFSSDDVSQYDVRPDGGLAPKAAPAMDVGDFPTGLTVSPDGASVYVTGLGSGGQMSQYDVEPGGTLTAKAPATVATGSAPQNIAVTPDGKSAYVTNQGVLELLGKSGSGWVGSGVGQYDIAADGALTGKSPAFLAMDESPFGIAVNPDGRSAYATAGRVYQYDVPASGTLTPKTPATAGAARASGGIVISPDMESAYAVEGVIGPTLDVDAKPRQRASKLKVRVSCVEDPCEVEFGGKAVARKGKKKRGAAASGRKKTIWLKRKSLSLGRGERAARRLRYRKHRKSAKALRRLLKPKPSRRRSRAKAVVNVTARDVGGNSTHESTVVKLKR